MVTNRQRKGRNEKCAKNEVISHVGFLKSYKIWALLSVSSQVVSIVTLKYAATRCGSYFCWTLIYCYLAVSVLIFFRVIFWNKALSRGSLSDVYVFTALTPVMLLWLSRAVLSEQTSALSIFGTFIIVFAIYMQQRRRRKAL
jgi:drug/metabolite transporter (DMT)-like permease